MRSAKVCQLSCSFPPLRLRHGRAELVNLPSTCVPAKLADNCGAALLGESTCLNLRHQPSKQALQRARAVQNRVPPQLNLQSPVKATKGAQPAG